MIRVTDTKENHIMSGFKFNRGQKVRVRYGNSPLSNLDGKKIVGRIGIIEHSWNPRGGINPMHLTRSEDVQFFEFNQYDIRVGNDLYLLNEDWLEEE